MGRKRSWTDDQLETAVRDATSWSDVLRRLNLALSGSTQKLVRTRALLIGLPTDHLVSGVLGNETQDPRPPVQDPSLGELLKLVQTSTNWTDLVTALGRAGGSGHSHTKHLVERHKIDVGHFRDRSEPRSVAPKIHPFRDVINPSALHRAAIGTAISWFLMRGHFVSIPVEPTSYDLVAETEEGLVRVQVKSTTSKQPSGAWHVGITRNLYDAQNNPGSNGRRRPTTYTEKEIDYFFIVCGDTSCYLISLEETENQQSLTLGKKYKRFKVQ